MAEWTMVVGSSIGGAQIPKSSPEELNSFLSEKKILEKYKKNILIE